MDKAPRMLLIGSAGRHAGKTEFACTLLHHFCGTTAITGVKITVIRPDDSGCPRGNSNCGVCTSLDDHYAITEETNRDGAKDTSRLLNAGAARVFWLRVLDRHMAEGMSALLEAVGCNTPIICESNSIRRAIEPDLFFMVKSTMSNAFKPTARAVADLADRIVLSDGRRFDLAPDRITLHEDGWRLREPATAIILAGGHSTRMGKDKSMLPVRGSPMVQHISSKLDHRFDEVLLSANDTRHGFLQLKTVPDRRPGMGPMMGVASALAEASHELAFVVTCDTPHIDPHLVHRMLTLAADYDVVVPRTKTDDGDLLEPLFAVYRTELANRLFTLLDQGERRIRRMFDSVRVCYVDIEPGHLPTNLNTEEEYRGYIAQTRTIV